MNELGIKFIEGTLKPENIAIMQNRVEVYTKEATITIFGYNFKRRTMSEEEFKNFIIKKLESE